MSDHYSEPIDQHSEDMLVEEPDAPEVSEVPVTPEDPPLASHTPRPQRKIPYADIAVVVALFALMVTGYHLRAIGRNWDDYTQLHPDERFLTDVASTVRSGRPISPALRPPDDDTPTDATIEQRIDLQFQECYGVTKAEYLAMTVEQRIEARQELGRGGYFDAVCSELNPNVVKETIFVYGSYPLFSTRTLAETYSGLTGDDNWTNYYSIRLVGRTMNSVFDTLTIMLIFLIGTQLFNRWMGLSAALFYTFAVFPIQQSHFWTADAFTAFWVVLSIYFAVRAMDEAGGFRDRFVALPWLGLGIGIWLWDMPNTNEISIIAPLLYLSVFLGVGLLNTLATEQRLPEIHAVAAGMGVMLLALATFAFDRDFISDQAFIAASMSVLALSGLWSVGYHRFAAYAGSWIWMTSAFSFWIYDSLANYGYDSKFQFTTPNIELLAAYVFGMTAVGLLASGLRHLQITERNTINIILAVAVPFIIGWVALILAIPLISMWGGVALLALAAFIGVSTYFGWQDEIGFGLAFGAALAGRVNVLPLVGVLMLALLIRALPLMLEWRVYRIERNFGLTRLGTGLVLAGMATLIAFRFLQPHAFLGPTVIDVTAINSLWRDDIREAQYLVSGRAEIPPNWQWTNRTPWLFPLQNIVIYGLGWCLGIAAVVGFIWAAIRILRGQQGWTRLAIPIAWIGVYFGWLGQNWVTTMRYFMPIYGMLALVAAWMLFELGKIAYRWWQQAPTKMPRRVGLGFASAMILAVPIYTVLYGVGSTNIYTTQMTRVAAARYAMEFIPGDFGLFVEGDDGNTRMINIGTFTYIGAPNIQTLEDGQHLTHVLNPPYSLNVSEVAISLLRDNSNDPEPEVVRVSLWATDSSGAEQLIGAQLIETDLNDPFAPYGSEHRVTFDPPVPLYVDPQLRVGSYRVKIEVIEGGPVTVAANIADPLAPAAPSHLVIYYSDPTTNDVVTSENAVFERSEAFSDVDYYGAGTIHPVSFQANYTGQISRIVVPHISDPFNDSDDETLRVTLVDGDTRVSGEVTGDFNTTDDGHLLFGPAVEILLDEPFRVVEGVNYVLEVQPLDFMGIAGSAVAWEGSWDDPMPSQVCPVPNGELYHDDLPSGLCTLQTAALDLYHVHYIGLKFEMAWDDEPSKRDLMLEVLNQTDYIIIGSNRFYDSFNRIPSRWPMSNAYYDALFSGELGFELERTFTSYATIGPFEWPDQILPSQDVPDWYNEFEAEEAFHVYTHPTVFIFRKTDAFSQANTERILGIPITAAEDVSPTLWWQIGNNGTTEVVNRLRWGAQPATDSPTALQFTAEEQAIQTEGGTFSDMFDRNALQNRSEVAGVILWWGTMLLMGWFTFPLLFWILPGLPDRGFALAKLVGWLVIAWVAWFGASLRFEIWTQSWLTVLTIGWFVLNILIAALNRQKLRQFIAQRWRHLLIVEGISLVLFLGFVGVRLGNPDLWWDPLGGEKPMNMAYFNGVLRSSIFPPIDPWYSGGYINYYYWGYVLVGAPTKLLGIMPSFAYNLILPTLFSFTGMGAFSVAYNLVQWSRERRAEASKTDNTSNPSREKYGPAANAYLAGMLALVMAVLLGNLGTVRLISTSISSAGGWQDSATYEQQALDIALMDFRAENGREPNEDEYEALVEETSLSNIEATQKWLNALWDGMQALANGEQVLNVTSNRWYWGPTRLIAELPEFRGHNAINEMPYFTFLYGDLHAHMIAMPVTLLVVLILTAEILGAGRGLRNPLGGLVALLLLGATVGLLRAINTWDWPTYMILSVFGLTFAAWVGQKRLRPDADPLPLYARLREYLDVWHVVRVWWLVGFAFVGMVLYPALYKYQLADYEQRLNDGEIPTFCQELDPEVQAIPDLCDGNMEPIFSLGRMVMAGGLTFGAVIVLYVVALVLLGHHFTQDAIAIWLARLLTFGIASVVAIWPYMDRFASAYGEILPWELDKTPLSVYLNIHGVFLFFIFSMLLWQTARWLRTHKVADLRGLGMPILAALGVVILTPVLTLYFGVFGEYKAFIVALPLLVWAITLFLLPNQSHIERWIYVLTGLALGLTMAVEMVVLNGDIGRQNTVFKFYIQVWLLFSIAAGVSLAWMLRSVERWMPVLGGVWQFSAALLLSFAMLFPITATLGKFEDRFNADETPLTLDGMAYMEVSTHYEAAYGGNSVVFNLNGDYHLIQWMQDNIEGTPVIIEAQHPQQYRWGGRISIYTGLPTVFGWQFHQQQQRNLLNFDRLWATRFNNVRAFYTTTDIEATWDLIEFYHIEYIVVGTLERILYEDVVPENILSTDPADHQFRTNVSPAFDRFDVMVEMGLLEVVYERPVCIYPDILTIEDCPPERVSTDMVYHVVEGAVYEQASPVVGAFE